MDDLLIKIVLRLASVYDRLGAEVFKKAAHNALLGIARAVHDEAEESTYRATPGSAPAIRLTIGRILRGPGGSDPDESSS